MVELLEFQGHHYLTLETVSAQSKTQLLFF